VLAWAFVADAIPLYALYALLFADRGLSAAEISALFAIWSAVGFVAEVPSGALADTFGRRRAVVAGELLQGAGFALWLVAPTFTGFAGGFVLWALGGGLISGAFEALLFDALAAAGTPERFARVNGQVTAAGLLAQLPAAAAATGLFALGGYALTGWVSVGVCVLAAVLAARLPEAPPGEEEDEEAPGGYLATLRAGVAEATRTPLVRRAVLAVAALFGLDALEEYLGLVARDWGVPTGLVPLAVLGVPLAGALGAAVGGRAAAARAAGLAGVLAAAALLLGAPALLREPAGLVAVTAGYGLYRLVLVVAEARLQERIAGRARATVTSVAALASEGSALLVYAAWAVGGLGLVAAVVLAVALLLPRLLRDP
jgi:MFS family permease